MLITALYNFRGDSVHIHGPLGGMDVGWVGVGQELHEEAGICRLYGHDSLVSHSLCIIVRVAHEPEDAETAWGVEEEAEGICKSLIAHIPLLHTPHIRGPHIEPGCPKFLLPERMSTAW